MSVIQNKLRLNKLEFATDNGKISIIPPASATYSLQLPNESGNNLQILSTNSNGILRWVNQNCPVIPTTISTFLVNPTSSNLRATIIGVSGTGSLVFSDKPTLSNITTDTIKLDSINATSSTISINGSINQNGSITSMSFIKTSGTSNQFLMADGSTVISDINPTLQNVYDNSSTEVAFNVNMSTGKNINFMNGVGDIVLSILNNTDHGIYSNSAVINSITASSITTSQTLFNADNQVVNKKYIDDVGNTCIQNISDMAKSIENNTMSINSLKSDVHEMTQEISRVIKLVEALTSKIDDNVAKVDETSRIVAFLTDRQ